jgi:hypothetical protein
MSCSVDRAKDATEAYSYRAASHQSSASERLVAGSSPDRATCGNGAPTTTSGRWTSPPTRRGRPGTGQERRVEE